MSELKIRVINGSPKGEELSTSIQYIKYMKKLFPDYDYDIIEAAKFIYKLENNIDYFNSEIEKLKDADVIIWASPVYFLLVPSQLKKFIELVYERNVQNIFENKYSLVIVTSVKFFDNLAADYLSQVSEDLKMKVGESLTFFSHELLADRTQKKYKSILSHFFYQVEKSHFIQNKYNFFTQSHSKITYKNLTSDHKVKIKNGVVITDYSDNENIKNVIARISETVDNIEICNLNDFNIKTGCISCVKCTADLNCCIDDGFRDFFEEKVRNKDVLIFVSSIKDKFFSAKLKQFFDRLFFANHTHLLRNKQLGFIFSGVMTQTIKDFIVGFSQWQGANLVDFITDQCNSSEEFDELLVNFLDKTEHFTYHQTIRPFNFLGVGSKKVLRDAIAGQLRYMFIRDYDYYKKNKLFDFPYKKWRYIKRNFIFGIIQAMPGMKKKLRERINYKIIEPFERLYK